MNLQSALDIFTAAGRQLDRRESILAGSRMHDNVIAATTALRAVLDRQQIELFAPDGGAAPPRRQLWRLEIPTGAEPVPIVLSFDPSDREQVTAWVQRLARNRQIDPKQGGETSE